MPVPTKILDAIEGDIRCLGCGRFVKIGEGKTLAYWSLRNILGLICPKCEENTSVMNAIKDRKQERV